MPVAFPFRVGTNGQTASAGPEEHVRDLIEQVLFTAPGERVNRPTFGTGLQQLVFAPSGPELGAATQFLVQGALQQWLGDVIRVEGVEVETGESTLVVTVRYTTLRDQQAQVATFTRGGAP